MLADVFITPYAEEGSKVQGSYEEALYPQRLFNIIPNHGLSCSYKGAWKA